MAIQNQYQLKIVNGTTGTAVLVASGNVTIHTINFPKATAGVVKVADGDGGGGINFPVASIGSHRFDAIWPNGVSVNAASADFFQVTYQTP